jgi:hypothetical protein
MRARLADLIEDWSPLLTLLAFQSFLGELELALTELDGRTASPR